MIDRPFLHSSPNCDTEMGVGIILFETLGSVLICVVLILLMIHTYSRIFAQCMRQKPSAASSTISSTSQNSQENVTNFSPPPSYEEVCSSSDVYFIVIEEEQNDSYLSGCHDYHKGLPPPTYEQVARFHQDQ